MNMRRRCPVCRQWQTFTLGPLMGLVGSLRRTTRLELVRPCPCLTNEGGATIRPEH